MNLQKAIRQDTRCFGYVFQPVSRLPWWSKVRKSSATERDKTQRKNTPKIIIRQQSAESLVLVFTVGCLLIILTNILIVQHFATMIYPLTAFFFQFVRLPFMYPLSTFVNHYQRYSFIGLLQCLVTHTSQLPQLWQSLWLAPNKIWLLLLWDWVQPPVKTVKKGCFKFILQKKMSGLTRQKLRPTKAQLAKYSCESRAILTPMGMTVETEVEPFRLICKAWSALCERKECLDE